MGFGLDDVIGGLDKAGDFIEDAVETGIEKGGQAVDSGLDSLSGFARDLGADGVADVLTDISDRVASATGGAVDELELGQTEDPRELIRGDVGAINEALTTLTEMGTNIESTGSALRAVDAAGWSGEAADSFNDVFDKQPGLWQDAADAMTAAAQSLTEWASVVQAAQARAGDALERWRQAEQHERDQKNAYNALSGEQRAATTLVDTWTPVYEDAVGILQAARTERNNAAAQIAGQLTTQANEAPEEPPFTQRMVANLTDLDDVIEHGRLNFESGLLTGLSGIVQFARQVNPTDPYNASHPAEYLAGMSDLTTGLVVAAADPGAVVHAFVEDAKANPFEFAGSLTGDALLTAATGGAGAGVAGARTSMRVADIASDFGGGLRHVDDIADVGRHVPTPDPPARIDTPRTDIDAPRTEPSSADAAAPTHPSSADNGPSPAPDTKPDGPDDTRPDPDSSANDHGSDGDQTTQPETPNDTPPHQSESDSGHDGAEPASPHPGADVDNTHPPEGPNPSPEQHAEADSGAARTADDAGPASDQTDKQVECVRDPVDAATGEFLLPEIDLSLPGVLPLVFGRRHRSNYRFGRWFGPSWSSILDMRVVVEESGVTFLAEDGVMVVYPHAPVGVAAVPRDSLQRWTLTRTDAGGYRVHDPDRSLTWHFAPKPDLAGLDAALGNLSISALTDRHRNRIRFYYGPDGAPTEVVHSGGYRVLLEARGGRIAAVSVVDSDGESPVVVRRFEYDGGQLTAVTNGIGGTTRYTYDSDGRMLSWRDSNGNRMINTYDGDGRVVGQDGTGGIMSARYEYISTGDGTGSVTVETNSVGARTAYGFDADLRLRDVRTPTGAQTHTDYNERRDPLTVTAPDGAITRYLYTTAGDVAQVTRPDGQKIRVDYAAPHKPSAVHQPDGTVTRQEWDETGNLAAAIDAGGQRTGYAYTTTGAVTSVTEPTGARVIVENDGAGLPIEVVDPTGARTQIRRDGFGRPVAVTDPLGAVTTYQWTPDGKLLERVHPDGSHEAWEYDGEGNLLRHTDPLGAATAYRYGAFDLLASRTDPDGSVTVYEWDTERRLVTVTNPLGHAWHYEYDADGRLAAETDFNGARTTYTHDQAGRVATVTPATGITRHHRHDVLGRLVDVRADTGEFRHYTHDLSGRTLSAVCGVGAELVHSLEFGYTPTGALSTQIVDGETDLQVDHDPFGRRTARRTGAGGVTGWQWDSAGRVGALTVDGHSVGLSYDSLGAVSGWRAGELALTRSRDVRGRLVGQEVTAHPVSSLNLGMADGPTAGPRVLRSDTFEYRADGYLTGQSITTDSVLRRSFDLDAAGRITLVVDDGAAVERYAYDGLSNVLEGGAASTVAEDDSRREYRGTLLIRDGRTRYHYDDAGRLIRKVTTRLSRKPDVWHYRYDAFDQLVEVVTPDGARWAYGYDALGRRLSKSRLGPDGGVVEQTRFTWDASTLVEQRTPEAVTRWAYQPGTHTPLTQTRAAIDVDDQSAVDAEFFAIVTDLVGSPTELVDPVTAQVAGSAKASLWGATAWSGEADTPIRFPGQYFDDETGLHYNLHRYYNPDTARYVTPDPLGLAPSPNPNSYPHNPTAWTDPLGLVPEGCEKIEFGDSIPDESQTIISQIREAGVIWEYGVRGPDVPESFANDGRSGSEVLPRLDSGGNPITYREWGSVPSPNNPTPGSERIVTGSDGSIYYTPDHYKRFIRWME
ncbi:putative T7SS-secreted protein [Rhodococcus sp. HNM0569]|uniref:putative T7SS-secreted protein n=1 Tax=Rhodococcus sp. HNM0569 TaxID=2716340 RepID=UPI00146D5542|nr:DUF6531 domain-containing protein [Rhodococcus sp. HNM0569]NLU81349.1 RHS repeat protein [Rhodococcus sp. HNM0569]